MPEHFNREAAEREANDIAVRFQDSGDVIKDMSRVYRADFSGIRIHSDEAADERVKRVGKDALASGRDVFFAKGILEQKDSASKGLLAHELAHTMQQGTAGGGEGAVRETAPAGAEQGGIIDWFKKKFSRRPRVQHLGGQKSDDLASQTYMEAMRAREQELLEGKRVSAMNQAGPAVSRDIHPEAMEALREQLQIAGGASNQAWGEIKDQDADSQGMELTPALKKSYALQAHGLRSSKSDVAKADSAVRASVFSGSTERYRKYMEGLDAGGADFRQMSGGREKFASAGGKEFETNDSIGAVSSDLFGMFGDYLQTDQGLEYLQAQMEGMQGMDMFRDTGISPMNYIMTSILTGEGAHMLSGMYRGDYRQDEEQDQGRHEVISHASRNLMVPLRMEEMTQEERDAMPESMKSLYQQYLDLQRRLTEMLGTRQ